MHLARSKKKPVHSFHSDSSYVACPACQGKHRPHTYKEGCRRAASEASQPIATPKPKPKAKSATDPDIKVDTSTKPEVKEEPKSSSTQPGKLISMPAPRRQDSNVKFDQSTLRQESDWREPFRHSNNPSSSSTSDKSKLSDPAPQIAPKSETPVPSIKPEVKNEAKLEERKEPGTSVSIPLALKRIHDKLSSPTELLKLHLKHYHMSTEQFKRRTSALKIPASINELYDKVVKQCDTCQKQKVPPSRAKVSGIRSETFGELTFIDHGEVTVSTTSKLTFLMIYDGASSLTTSYVVQTKSDRETIDCLMEYFETYQLTPKYIVGDQAFMGLEMESFYNRMNVRPISLGIPWPNRSEAAVRMYKKQVTLMLKTIAEDPALGDVTYRQLLRQASLAAKNSMVTHGGVTPLEMAFGRRPADILSPEAMTPAQLTTEVPTPEKKIDALRTIAMKAYLEAKQSDDLKRDIAAKLQLSDGPYFPGDRIYYWTEDKSKIKSDGSHCGKWIKGKIISVDGSMIGIDLGTRILKVNVSKIRKDVNPIEDVDIPLDPLALLSEGRHCDQSERESDPVNSTRSKGGAQMGVEGHTYSSYNWQPTTKGKIDFLELFSGSARLSQVAAMNGLKVGQPIDLRTGFDILTPEGRRRATKIIERQRPKVIHMAPICGPWSQMNNINDQEALAAKRRKYLPMLEFCVQVAIFQIEHGGYFIIENPATSALWYTRCFQRLLRQSGVSYGTLDMCSCGMKDPNGYYYYKPTSLLHNFGDEVFKRCINKLGGDNYHYHQQLEGNAPGHGSRTKLAQVYPYRFCSTLIRSILPTGRHYGLFHAQTALLVDLLDDLTFEETKSLSAHVSFELPQEFVHYSSLASKSAAPVKDYFVKRLMNQINALAAGYEYNPCHLGLGHEVMTLRNHFSPYMSFDNATILRGTFELLRVHYRQTSGLFFCGVRKMLDNCMCLDTLIQICLILCLRSGVAFCFGTLMVAFLWNTILILMKMLLCYQLINHLTIFQDYHQTLVSLYQIFL